MLKVDDSVAIPDGELEVKASRASGAGGQHVNKTSSRIEITWNIQHSRAITDEQRQILLERLANRIAGDGTVRVVASEFRSQKQNRERAETRLAELIRKALTPRKKRKPTRRPRAANEARLATKKLRSLKKRERRTDEY
ncbi:MAG TPA: alternative ribosome rescue aminoacyl-tRNA hydrolase ArfB [Gemmatimonadaceae bacterium]|nr:alternative ribosome rescue aminoacyl-tRNA hydrolase ArfB [Gemmatimonadaceae bacterium]